MCGITGFFEKRQHHSHPQMENIAEGMLKTINHRGPDGNGIWQDPEMSLLLGHTRLSILDLTSDGAQPMVSHSDRYVISYNGEIYNFQEIQSNLEKECVIFRGRSDTEVLLEAIDHCGLNQVLQKINGMYAFALWDRETRQLHLVRDRFGKKPLYVGWAGESSDTLVFASELKAFCAYPHFKKQINRKVLSLFMRYGCVPAPYCIYENVWQLPAGCRLTLDLESLESSADLSSLMQPYWRMPEIVAEARQKTPISDETQAIREFESLFKKAVETRMISDVPLGAFLSGGIDSSAVVAMMQQISDQPVKTFSIGFDVPGYNEAPHAKKIAAHLGTDHHELYLKPEDALNVIPSLPDLYDEPFADPSQIPTYLVSLFAREQVTVALSGDGGDEMLGGYLRHSKVPALWQRVGWMPVSVRRAMGAGITALPAARWNNIMPHHPQFGERIYKVADILACRNDEDVYRTLVSQWQDPEALVLGAEEPLIPLFDPSWQTPGLKFAERMMYGDALSYLPNDILVKLDRASMAVSLEARSPLLDKELFEYVWRLPFNMKVRNGQGKWLLRQVLKNSVPEELFDRPKQGFTMPIAEWLRGPLKGWAEDLLAEDMLRQDGYLDAALVRKIWDEHQNGKGRHASRLWCVLMFQSWLQRWG